MIPPGGRTAQWDGIRISLTGISTHIPVSRYSTEIIGWQQEDIDVTFSTMHGGFHPKLQHHVALQAMERRQPKGQHRSSDQGSTRTDPDRDRSLSQAPRPNLQAAGVLQTAWYMTAGRDDASWVSTWIKQVDYENICAAYIQTGRVAPAFSRNKIRPVSRREQCQCSSAKPLNLRTTQSPQASLSSGRVCFEKDVHTTLSRKQRQRLKSDGSPPIMSERG